MRMYAELRPGSVFKDILKNLLDRINWLFLILMVFLRFYC